MVGAHTHNATDMFCSSKLKTTPRGGESPPSRDGKAPPNGVASGGDVDQPLSDQLLLSVFVQLMLWYRWRLSRHPNR